MKLTQTRPGVTCNKKMSSTASFTETHLPSSSILLALVLPLLFFVRKWKLSKNRSILPPGPKPWPVVGNLLDIGSKPHVALARLAKVHGPLISVRLGSQLVVVGSSPAAATEILKTHDQELSGRCVPHVSFAKDPEMNKDSIAWTFECTERWKYFRSLMRTELFSSKIVDGQSGIRERKVREMVEFLGRKEGVKMEIREVAFVYTFNVLANIYLSKDFIGFEEGEEGRRVSGLVREMMELYTALNVSDLYPALGSLDLQGLRKKTDECVRKIRELWEHIVAERRKGKVAGHDSSGSPADFLDVLLASGLSDEQISFILVELLAAVSDSSSSTIEWAMSELIRNPETMESVREELAREISSDFVTESQLASLPYLQAWVKETLRLHPPAPILLPHRATVDCQVMEYTVPKDAQVFVNVWAIARDPSYWEDPLQFRPERFINSELDYKGNHFEYLPFGSGRRICAGMPLAIRKVQLALANLVHRLDWSLPNNMPPNELDMEERYGVTLMKEQPLVLIPKRRS